MITENDLVAELVDNPQHYRSVAQKMHDAVSLLDDYKSEDRRDGFGPDVTVKAYIERVGKPAAEVIIASLVNECAWDGRISPRNAEWARGIEQAFDGGAMRHMHIYTTMHMCHLDQIATMMRRMCNGEDITQHTII